VQKRIGGNRDNCRKSQWVVGYDQAVSGKSEAPSFVDS
jgi:hypothetical protein